MFPSQGCPGGTGPGDFKCCPCCSMAGHPLEKWSLPRGAAATTITSFRNALLITSLHTQNLRPGQCFSLQHSALASSSFICNLKVGCPFRLRHSSVDLSSYSLRPDHSQWGAHGKGSRLTGTSSYWRKGPCGTSTRPPPLLARRQRGVALVGCGSRNAHPEAHVQAAAL